MSGGQERGIDLAWAWALLGVMASSVVLWWPSGDAPWIVWLLEGPPVVLLAMLAGVSTTMAVGPRLASGDLGGALRATIMRGLLVAMLGLVLGAVAYSVWGVLAPIGIAIAVGAVALVLPTWAVAVLAGLLAINGGWMLALARQSAPVLEQAHSITTLMMDPYGTAADIVAAGLHPALTLLTAVLVGVIVARVLERGARAGRRRATLGAIAGGGALLATIGIAVGEIALLVVGGAFAPGDPALAREWLLASGRYQPLPSGLEYQLLSAPLSGTPVEVVRMLGLALLAIGTIGLLADLAPGRLRPWLEPARALGAAMLTMYAVHALAYTALGQLGADGPPWATGWDGMLLHLAICLIALSLLAARGVMDPIGAGIDHVAERVAGGRRPLRPAFGFPDDTSLTYEVQLHAPIERVWQAITDPELVRRWSEHPSRPILRSEGDVRTGGTWRWQVGTAVGAPIEVFGEYLQVEAPTTLVQTMRTAAGGLQMTSIDRLFQFDGVTTLRTRNVYPSERARARGLAGLRINRDAWTRLAALVEQPDAMRPPADARPHP